MNKACRNLRDSLARGPGEVLGSDARAHLATCADCRAQAAANDRFILTLRQDEPPIDDFARTRLLARLGPELDDLAARRGGHRPSSSRRWLVLVATAAVAAGVTWWSGRTGSPPPQSHLTTVELEREQIQPYVIAGSRSDSAAATLLAGKFSTLVVGDHELVRATAGDRDVRIAAIGPSRIDVERATATTIELAATGTLLVDAHASRSIGVRIGTLTVHASNAIFAVQQSPSTTVIFVARGELELPDTRLHAGEWYGPSEARSASLVTALRDQEHASSPPTGRSGILAIDGDARAVIESGAVLGSAPLWARLAEGEVVVLVTDPVERRVPVAIHAGSVSHVPAATVQTAAITPPASDRPLPPRGGSLALPAARAAKLAAAGEQPAPSLEAGVVEAPVPTAAELYTQAEAALRVGDRAQAAATWTRLVAQYPDAAQAASALYDLAGLARARGDRAAARGYLTQLDQGTTPAALREPAHYLSCRLAVEANDLSTATTCFTSFRAAFPRSSHDDEVLAWLAGHAQETSGCGGARTLDDEYLQRYPHGTFAARARACEHVR